MSQAGSGQFKRTWIFLGIFVFCAALIKPAQDRLEAGVGAPGPAPDLLYFSSPPVVKRMALSYDRLLADFYWMRTIQYYGRRDEADKRPVRYKNLPALLDITTTLDPDLMDAYRFGSIFLGEEDPLGAGKPEEALKLLDKGIQAHPQEWQLVYDKGLVYYWYMKDYQKAGEIWREASRLPGAPHWLEPMAAMAFTKGGEVELALALWQSQYDSATRSDVRENALNHVLSIEAAKDIWTLEFMVQRYRERTGAFPRSLKELARLNPGKCKIADPLGTPYQYNPATGAVWLSQDAKFKYLEVPYSYKEQIQSRLDG